MSPFSEKVTTLKGIIFQIQTMKNSALEHKLDHDLPFYVTTIEGEFPDHAFFMEEKCGCDPGIDHNVDILSQKGADRIDGKRLVLLDDVKELLAKEGL